MINGGIEYTINYSGNRSYLFPMVIGFDITVEIIQNSDVKPTDGMS